MKKKLIRLFFQKERKFLFLSVMLFVVSGIYLGYQLMTYTSFYYNWEFAMDLDDTWYWYWDNQVNYDQYDEIEKFLLEKRGGISGYEYRHKHCRYAYLDQVGWDKFDCGVLFQASQQEIEDLREKFPDFQQILTVPEFVKEERRTVSENGYFAFGVMVLIWGISIGTGVFWFRKALLHSEEEYRYLRYVGYPLSKIRRMYCTSFFCFFPLIYIGAFAPRILAVFPSGLHLVFTRMEFWRIYPCIPLLLLLFLVLALSILSVLYLKVWDKTMKKDISFGASEHRYIGELSLAENLELILIAQGYSEKAAQNLVKEVVSQKEIAFCANHIMSLCPGREKMTFYKLQEELLNAD